MQNHAPYEHEYKNNDFKNLIGDDADLNKLINTFSQGINYTDQATKAFIDSISKLDKKVIVVLYGDHLPGIYEKFGSGFDMYETDFFIYSNFSDQRLSSNGLTPTIMINNYVKEVGKCKNRNN